MAIEDRVINNQIQFSEGVPMESVKERLKNLSQHMPNHSPITYDFGLFLADRLNPRLVPRGFVMAVEFALYDLEKGVDGFTKRPLDGRLTGCPSIFYHLLRMQTPQIAEAVCPEDFAREVKTIYESIQRER